MMPADLRRFLVTGALGFGIDSSMFALLLLSGSNPYAARLLAFLAAVGVTYLCNRHWTFRQRAQAHPGRYLAVQATGAGINMLVFAAVIHYPVWLPQQYYAGQITGALVAMVFNFHMSKRHVFGDR
ncbi:MAG: GtrA family protein [Pseudomonadota bacterium]